LYTIWSEGTVRGIAFAVIHCFGGDLLIALGSLLTAMLLAGNPRWPMRGSVRVGTFVVLAGVGYTIFSEWLNVELLKSWEYADSMPVLPFLGIGVSPLAQWIVVPSLALWWAHRTGRFFSPILCSAAGRAIAAHD
jgi:hypothetical protein